MVEQRPSMHEVLSSNSSTIKKKKRVRTVGDTQVPNLLTKKGKLMSHKGQAAIVTLQMLQMTRLETKIFTSLDSSFSQNWNTIFILVHYFQLFEVYEMLYKNLCTNDNRE
jgi:hypothetical protein